MNYEAAVQWLYATQLHGIKLGLENIQRLVEALQIRVSGPTAPRFIHVAGTNGKGSVCAMLAASSRAGGRRTGLFTSPHLVTFRERIQIDRAMIPELEVAAGLQRIRTLTESWERPPTFFEITTALALAWFQENEAETIILETGMGGRLDATNVVSPAAVALTPIALDHQQYLGATLSEIAAEKAGIIKPGVPVFSAPQDAEVVEVFEKIASKKSAPLQFITAPWPDLQVAIPGSHQRWNAALAARTLQAADPEISPAAIAEGLRTVDWPGRFQALTPRLFLDGAHNPAAAERLVETWREAHGTRRATLVLGILRDKDIRGICQALLPIAGRILVAPVKNPRSATPQEICRIIGEIAPRQECIAVRDLAGAVRFAQSMERRILVTGSLFFVGEALALFSKNGSDFQSSTQ